MSPPTSSPVVVGATGGSGTRVVARILRYAGRFLGTQCNGAEDAMPFVPFYRRWIHHFLAPDAAPLGATLAATMEGDFDRCLAEHLATRPDSATPWGWKNPRSIYFLPFLHARFPSLRYIHVVRDGRDMAFSSNQL